MEQVSFSDAEFAGRKRVTRRERLLQEIDQRVPWSRLVAEIESFCPLSGRRGRPSIGVERMPRMYVIQQILDLSGEGTEDAIYDSQSVRGCMGLDLSREAAPDATTLLKFRPLLERNDPTGRMFETITSDLADQGLFLKQGTVVDATLVAVASSAKNRARIFSLLGPGNLLRAGRWLSATQDKCDRSSGNRASDGPGAADCGRIGACRAWLNRISEIHEPMVSIRPPAGPRCGWFSVSEANDQSGTKLSGATLGSYSMNSFGRRQSRRKCSLW